MYKLAIIFTLKELGYRNKVIEDIFFTKYFTEYFSRQWETEVLKHLAVKFDFRVLWKHFPTILQNNVPFYISYRLHRLQSLQIIKLGGPWYQRIHAIKSIE